jgi:large subunit ribosomal protein L32
MAIAPPRRIGKTRKRKRRTHFKLEVPGIMVCPNCGETKLAHTVCRECGFYDGKKVLTIKEKAVEEQVVEEQAVKKPKKVKAAETMADVKSTKKAVKKVDVTQNTEPKKAVRRVTKKADKAE